MIFTSRDVKEWLKSRGIAIRDAKRIYNWMAKNYPYLHRVVRQSSQPHRVKAELDLIQLVVDIKRGRLFQKDDFPSE